MSTGVISIAAARASNTKTIVLNEARGVIYDCNGVPLTGVETEYRAVVPPSENALSVFQPVLSPEQFELLKTKLQKGQTAVVPLEFDSVKAENIPVYEIKKRYSENQLAAHVIGYLHSDSGQGVSGIEKSYDELLSSANGKLKVRFSVDAKGRILPGETPYVSQNEYNVKQGIRLTLDKNIQEIAERALDSSDIKRGAVVVLEVKTGKIRAMVSRPTFSPANPAASLNSSDSPFINRALTPYAVGSIFKPVVAAVALKMGISPNFQYTCTGSIQKENTVFHCHERDGHGTLTMEEAIKVSCNPYFINLSSYLNVEEALEEATLFGLGAESRLAPAIVDSAGTLPSEKSLSSSAAFANFSFGQGAFTATPLQMAAVYSAIANGGVYIRPVLIEGKVNSDGAFSPEKVSQNKVTVTEKRTAEMLCGFLKNTVESGSGKRAKPQRTAAAGKTATAQSGQYKNGSEILHTWFAGFFPADNPKYAVVIMNENGSSGAVDCAPVFKKIADNLF